MKLNKNPIKTYSWQHFIICVISIAINHKQNGFVFSPTPPPLLLHSISHAKLADPIFSTSNKSYCQPPTTKAEKTFNFISFLQKSKKKRQQKVKILADSLNLNRFNKQHTEQSSVKHFNSPTHKVSTFSLSFFDWNLILIREYYEHCNQNIEIQQKKACWHEVQTVLYSECLKGKIADLENFKQKFEEVLFTKTIFCFQ